MKKLVAIVLIASLYSPQVAQIVSYSQCAILATFNVDVSLCDCLKKSTTTYHTTDGYLNSEVKNSTTKVSWNYNNDNSFNIPIQPIVFIANKPISSYNKVFPNAPSSLVFRPPC